MTAEIPASPLVLLASNIEISHTAHPISEDDIRSLLHVTRTGKTTYYPVDPGSGTPPDASRRLLSTWQMTGVDGGWVATIRPESYSLETGRIARRAPPSALVSIVSTGRWRAGRRPLREHGRFTLPIALHSSWLKSCCSMLSGSLKNLRVTL